MQKIDIVLSVIVHHTPTKDLAKKYRITESYVTRLCSRAKKNPEFLRELFHKEEQERSYAERAARVIEL